MGSLHTRDVDCYSILQDRISGALSMLQEMHSVDFKRADVWNNLKYKITKSVIAMSNLQDGGIIIVGVAEQDNKWNRTGMTEKQLNTYNPDDMIDHVNKYASPSITFDVVKHADGEELKYLVVQAHEFDEKPIVCKKDYSDELRRGALYIRPLGKAESREVRSAEELHTLLELAIEKRTRSFLSQIQRVGIDLGSISLLKSDADKYDEESEGF